MPNFSQLKPFLFATICVVACLLNGRSATAETMVYRWDEGQKFSYQMEVVVEAGDETITYKGMIHYEVNEATDAQATVTYRGGLSESKKFKQRNRGVFGPFGPRGFGPSFPSPFSRPTFTGKTKTTNRLTITSSGQTLAMDGDSQLPYLLGNVSLIPFETLPDADQGQWTSDSGVAITEKDDDQGPFGRFGPMSPFGNSNSKKSVQSAGEVTTYVIKSSTADEIVVSKTYRLFTPPVGDKASFEMVGDGTWTFDPRQQVPVAGDMSFSLKVTKDNTTTTIPISLKFDRVSQEKIAELETAAKLKAEQMAKAAAEKKALAETPLTAEESESMLKALASGDAASLRAKLDSLAQKSLSEPDPQIAAAIEPHLASADRNVANAAHKAMSKWSPEYAQRKKLEKAYQGPGPVGSTERVVESTTPLFVGQVLQAQHPRRGTFWRAAKVKQLLEDGQVEISFLSWGKERDLTTVSRRYLQLAPAELAQPDRPQSMPVANATGASDDPRTWTDATGRFKVQGVFIGLVDGNVNLKRADGRTLSIPLDKLSAEDRKHVDQVQAAENPFKLN
ncbi:MAG: SHD1 domain-containing protein [Rubripirellula sp.]